MAGGRKLLLPLFDRLASVQADFFLTGGGTVCGPSRSCRLDQLFFLGRFPRLVSPSSSTLCQSRKLLQLPSKFALFSFNSSAFLKTGFAMFLSSVE